MNQDQPGAVGSRGVALAAIIAILAVAGAMLTGGPTYSEISSETTNEVASVGDVPADAVAFYASSLETGFSTAGDYGGRIWLDGSGLHVHIPAARLEVRSDQTGWERLEAIRLELARRSESGRWSAFASGPLEQIGRDLEPGEIIVLEDLRLDLPGVGARDLAGAWPVITHELTVTNVDGGPAHRAWTYAHGEPVLFQRLLTAGHR